MKRDAPDSSANDPAAKEPDAKKIRLPQKSGCSRPRVTQRYVPGGPPIDISEFRVPLTSSDDSEDDYYAPAHKKAKTSSAGESSSGAAKALSQGSRPRLSAKESSGGSQPKQSGIWNLLHALSPNDEAALTQYPDSLIKPDILRDKVSPQTFAIVKSVYSLEMLYVDELKYLKNRLRENMNRSGLREDLVDWSRNVSTFRNMNPLEEKRCRDPTNYIVETDQFRVFRHTREMAERKHGQALLDLGPLVLQGLLPLSEQSKRAIEAVRDQSRGGIVKRASSASGLQGGSSEGSQPRRNYKDVLVELGLIKLRTGFRGRKPGSQCFETPLTWEERQPGYDWSSWCMKIGRYKELIVIAIRTYVCTYLT